MYTTETSNSNAIQTLETAKVAMAHLEMYGYENPRIFRLYGQKPQAVKDALYKKGVQFLELKTANLIIVEQEDYENCNLIAENTHYEQIGFLQEFEKEELQSIIATHPKITDKKFIQIKNLAEMEKDTLLEKCNRIKQGLLVETDTQKDGRYEIGIPIGLLTVQERRDVSKAYISSVITCFGTRMLIHNEENLTSEHYDNVVKENTFISEVLSSTIKKLEANGLSLAQPEEYLTSLNKQTAYVLTQLTQGKEILGISENEQEHLSSLYSALSNIPYEYAVESLKTHKITSVFATEKEKTRNEQEPTR